MIFIKLVPILILKSKDGGGTITKEELGELMKTLGIDATPEEIEQMISEVDKDGSGSIDFGKLRVFSIDFTYFFLKLIFRGIRCCYVKKGECNLHLRSSQEFFSCV